MDNSDDDNVQRREGVTHSVNLAATVETGASVSVGMKVDRGLNDTRLAVLGIIVTIGLTVGFGIPGAWWVRLLAGTGSFVATCALIRWNRSRHLLMSFTHWLTQR